MKPVQPASVHSEPSAVPGVSFLEAAGRACVWPLGGSGAQMVVCGDTREPASAYCHTHRQLSRSGHGIPVRLRV